ncbi:plastocyanin/azurin family copper-binding protein [Aliifodinibius sp. S!AR15-10]|uniref:plastocyanin/azurin family copper-binding protein n=1 Tax=Aliifodinibius sp. S!AR15-10 TaxID=2950437 RepID=UPI0028709086|nr:plastocyanin/azurin family copper-binding protein [Aliifodinibius sp. S!AR15-10]
MAGLKYDKVRFMVSPGSTVRITLENVDEMMHNMLIVKPETRVSVVKAAETMGERGVEHDFIPKSSNVLESTPLLGPGGQASILFKVPDKETVYPYVCTYPAHGMVMYGAIYATRSPDDLPPLDEDPNIPEQVRNQMAASMSLHPYPRDMPTLTRLFMPESSPAAIAVGMEKEQSYNWDAGYSFLRYVWDGGYIDVANQWDGKAHEVAKIKGDIYYRNTTGFPFRVSHQDSVPQHEFQGYRMIDGYPRFKYDMGDITVSELILPAQTTPGFRIEYVLENVDQPIWYALSDNDEIRVEVSKGTIEGDMVKLTPDQAQEFTISIISEE